MWPSVSTNWCISANWSPTLPHKLGDRVSILFDDYILEMAPRSLSGSLWVVKLGEARRRFKYHRGRVRVYN